MNKEESLALYEKGVEAWNAWANKMLAKKAELEKCEPWQTDKDGFRISEVTKVWERDSEVDFSDHVFDDKVDFSGFIFPYSVNFENATFSSHVKFTNAIFGGNAIFLNATFSHFTDFVGATFNDSALFYEAIFNNHTLFNIAKFGSVAVFNNATFSDFVMFKKAIFRGNAPFDKAKFTENADFDGALFENSASFNDTNFKRNSSFVAIEGKSLFSFQNTEFHLAPDFNQAHFTEAPQFDNSDFSKALNRSRSESEGNISSNWRALKRLAIQGHDHERELIFFAAEIKSQRGKEDKALPNPLNYFNDKPVWPGGSRYWFGYFYQCFSDFGRSIMRPLSWWLGLGALFLFLYLKYPIDAEPQATVSCDRTEAALYLSVRNALPFLPATGYSENLSRSYACLYGKHSDGKEKIPNAIVFMSIVQTILSTILIFLLLLALRNHFKIK
ncbi:MAG: hypothetical protein DU480_05075 [Nitrosomonas sp.]|uniref:pentapeptide repeat-containing protein n=1 Tax=Nitrosomonas sp. TaxID=42353 RepID=UPI0032ECB585